VPGHATAQDIVVAGINGVIAGFFRKFVKILFSSGNLFSF